MRNNNLKDPKQKKFKFILFFIKKTEETCMQLQMGASWSAVTEAKMGASYG
jgi:hypothetical protein